MPPQKAEIMRQEIERLTAEKEVLRAQKNQLESTMSATWIQCNRHCKENVTLRASLAGTQEANQELHRALQKSLDENAEMKIRTAEMEKAQNISLDITKALVLERGILETSVAHLENQVAILQGPELVRENEELRARVAYLEARLGVQEGWPADAPAASEDSILDCLDA